MKKILMDELKELRQREKKIEEFKRLKAKFEYIYRESAALIVIIGMDRKIKDINNAVIKNLGYSRSEVIGKNVIGFLVPREKKRATKQLEKVLKGEKNPEIFVDVYAKDNSIRNILIAKDQALLHDGDNPTGILIVGTDITRQKEIEKELRESEKQYGVPPKKRTS